MITKEEKERMKQEKEHRMRYIKWIIRLPISIVISIGLILFLLMIIGVDIIIWLYNGDDIFEGTYDMLRNLKDIWEL